MPPARSQPPTAPPPGSTRGRRTRQRLLDAGAAVFAERGVHAARVDDIVKLAATSHGTFYLYFANKEELFRALAEQVAADLEAVAARLPPLTTGATGRAALESWLDDFAHTYEARGAVIRTWVETELVANEIGQLANSVWGAFVAAFATRIRESEATDLDPGATALMLVAMIERANYYRLTGHEVLDVDGPATLARVAQSAVFCR